MKNPSVLFLNPPSIPYQILMNSFPDATATMPQVVSMPMGLLYLAAVLERDLPTLHIEIVDLAKAYREWIEAPTRPYQTFDELVEDTLLKSVQETPSLIGISILFSTADKSARAMARVCKQRWPGVPVLLGGMHATNAVSSLLQEPAIDYVCRGEGESIITEVVRQTEALSTTPIPGLVGRHTLMPENCPLIDDLDQIPYPAWHLIPMADYVHRTRARSIDVIEQDREATIMTTRGCPLRCTFCSSWTVHGRDMRYRSLENVLGELRLLRDRYGVCSVIPEDDLFTVKKDRIVALCHAVADEFPGMTFHFPNGLAVFTLDRDVIRAMKRMGMKVANIAIESGSQEVQARIIKKHVNLDRARQVVQTCREEGVIARCYFVVGFPGETRAQIQETIEYAGSLPADWCVFSIAAPLVGTEMYEQLLARGDISTSFNWDTAFYQERSYDSSDITASDLKSLVAEANERINFRRNYNLRTGNGQQAAELFRDILRVYPEHELARTCLHEAEAMR